MSKRKHPTLIHYDIPEIITDEFIKEFCNHNIKCKETFFINQRLFKVLNYLKNRYNDRKEFNVHEVIYRIKNNIEHLPICPICKKPIEFHRKYLQCNSDAIILPADIGLVVSPVKVNL